MENNPYEWTWLLLKTIIRTLFFMAVRNHHDDGELFLWHG